METNGISPITLASSDISDTGRTETPFNEDNFASIGKAKIDALQTSVDEINDLIEEREELSNEIFRDGEKTKIEINNFILANEKADNSLEKEDALIGLRQKKVDMTELQLNEKVSCWKDVALLKKELREKEQELTERSERLKVLTEILE